jgi:tRNA nucleotidyltransferase (CCA-adding enzyme)
VKFPDRLQIPEVILEIARRLESAGFETWCVGGAVRDNLLELPNKDFDLATAARPEQVRELFHHTIPVGMSHGTVAVLDRGRHLHEVTTFRRDVRTDGRHAEVEFGATLEEDLARRDLTINAVAYHPLRHEWRDPFDGGGDLDRKLIRAVGDPAQRFREDYLRILRVLRFAARFGFRIDPPTWEAATAAAEGLRSLSAERVRDEWFRGLETAEVPSELVASWNAVGAIEIWLPEVLEGLQKAGRELRMIDRLVPRDPVLITSFLSGDPVATLSRLRCSNAEIERGRGIRDHPRPESVSDVAVRRWLAEVGPQADDLLAIWTAEGEGEALGEAIARVRGSGAPLTLKDLAVNGDDLVRAGVPKGPAVGEILRALLDDVLEDPSRNQRGDLLRRARGHARRSGSDTGGGPPVSSRSPDADGRGGVLP